uniref:VWFC domain-containing protein n=1 Tax=Bactrocera latifrons TaxID=174628 RepID=A0A0K8UZZ9_BACLA
MLRRSIGAALLALLCLWPAHLDAFVAQSLGCHHNGTWYADRSLVPTVEKCLTCQCQRKTLVCRLKVCPEMPMPPPRGCIVVQQRNACCPYLSCARLDAFYKIPATRRIIAYLDHYERESIDRVVNDNMLQRRSDDSEVDMYVCVKNGTVYKSGSAMSSSNLCTYCYCIGGTEKCVKPKCMLPVEGCKPIFVDSTCCPVRYDCTSKPSGKSSQEVRYRKTSNKHYLRMSQRLQRNRGCTVNKQFYVEGQKMRSDPDKPCDICFCIRGTRRCAPKKCSPALKNCIPVVPKGQCCPSSYDCGSQRAQSSRQFNLFSLLFGKEDELNGNDTKKIPAEYPPDRHPSVTVTHNQNILEKNDEKSILDTIREGLEIIDGNNDEVIAQNIEKLAAPLTQVVTESQINTQSTVPENAATEVSFLDLLLGADDDELSTKVTEEVTPELKTTTGYDGLSWVDILLGPDEDDQKQTGTTAGDRASIPETTTNNQNAGNGTSIDRIDQDFEDFSGSGEIIVGEPLSSESSESSLVAYPVLHKSSIDKETYVTLQKPLLNNTSVISVVKPGELTVSTTESPKTTYSTTAATTKLNATKTPQSTVSVKQTTPTAKTTQRPAIKSSAKPTQSTTKATPKPSQKPIELKFKPRSTQKPIEKLQKTTTSRPLNITQTELQNTIEKKKNGLLTALLDGLSDMLNSENVFNSTQNKIPSNSTTTTSTTTNRPKDTIVLPTPKPKPLPSFKPLPMRINSKIANLTVTAEVVKTSLPPNVTAFKPLPGHMVKSPIVLTSTQAPVTTTTTPQSSTSVTSTTTTSSTTTEKSTTTTGITSTTTKTTTASSTPAAATSSSTLKPVLINTNPTILESDPFDANAEPTLPPSLPNLKIIPFLPTDAVKADRTKPLYDYYHSNAPTAKIDYDQYDEGNIYPAITEPHFPNYSDIADGSKAEYIYKFNVEGPSPPVTSSTAGKSDGSSGGAAAFVKYDFVGAGDEHKGFSPPTETEGGFVPKDPLVLSDTDEQVDTLPYVDTSYQVTKHLIDITTADPLRENSTKVIEITTPDPFKDVIRTEQPPDLTSLIEDKEHILVQKPIQLQPPKVFEDPENISQSLIHITTAVPQSANALDDELPPLTMFAETTNEQNDSRAPNEEHQNTIASFLDLLLGGEIDLAESHSPHNLNASSTVVPPFKTLPQASLELLPDITTTSATAKPKRVTTTTRVPTNSTATNTTKRIAVKTNSIATTVSSFTKLNGTAFAANNNTKPIPNPKTPITQKTRVGTTSTSITTKISSTTRPKSTRPKSGSTRRQTTKTPIAIAASQKRVNSITALRNPNNRNTTTSPLPSTASKGTAAANKPLQRSPFDTLPFMDTSFEVKRTTERPYVVGQHTGGDFLGLLYYKNSLNQVEGLEPARESALHGASSFSSSATKQTTASTTTTNSVPLVQRNIEQIISATASAPIALDAPTAANPLETQHSASNSLIDPSGVLKLAGCNIYGRMYRVGRIILELSSPCLECKCTEVGVKCGQLEC